MCHQRSVTNPPDSCRSHYRLASEVLSLRTKNPHWIAAEYHSLPVLSGFPSLQTCPPAVSCWVRLSYASSSVAILETGISAAVAAGECTVSSCNSYPLSCSLYASFCLAVGCWLPISVVSACVFIIRTCRHCFAPRLAFLVVLASEG